MQRNTSSTLKGIFRVLVVVLFCSTLSAQQPVEEKWRIRGTVGYSRIYLDEPGDLMLGGSVGISLTERWSLEPEFYWISGKRFEDTGFAVNGVYDFADPGSRVTPYAVFGVGYKSMNWDKYANQ